MKFTFMQKKLLIAALRTEYADIWQTYHDLTKILLSQGMSTENADSYLSNYIEDCNQMSVLVDRLLKYETED